MKKCVIDIKLMKWPTICNSKAEDNANGSGLDDWTKSFFVISARSLVKTFRN